jgi:hypothetical protein
VSKNYRATADDEREGNMAENGRMARCNKMISISYLGITANFTELYEL